MTAGEAINCMKNEKCCILVADKNYCSRECSKCDLVMETDVLLTAYDTAIKALEKQIPKKLVFYGDSDDGKILCPYCETDLYDDRECLFNNCPYCGQAINWDGLEE